MDKTKRKAAQHSLEAFSLLTAARLLRRAADDLQAVGEDALAKSAKQIATKADRRRRSIQAK